MMAWVRISMIMICMLLVGQGSVRAAEVGEPSPEFQFQTINGQQVSFSELKGEKPIFLVFWATWCRTCKDEIPVLNELYKKFSVMGMEFLAVGVGINDSEARVKRFAMKNNLSYPVAFDAGGKITKEFGIFGTPTVLVIDREGIIRYRDSNLPADLEDHFASLMGS